MNLKNPELFRSWLIRQLEPICKANPEPVSKYVCALLKKEKSDGELKESLISQLDIFFESDTEEFVNFLIDVLENEKYLNEDVDFQPSETTNMVKDDDVKLDTSIELELEIGDKDKEQRKSPSPIQAPTPSPPRRSQFQKSFSPRQSRRSRFRNERRRPGDRKSRRDSSHSDSPGAERRIAARRRSASGSSESSNKSPRRSWIASRPSDAKKYKHRNFVARSPLAGQRSRSNSPKIRKRKPTNGNFRKRARQVSRSNSDDERSYNIPQPKRVVNYQNEITREIHAPEMPANEPTFNQKQRCIDFESKGYCARGDMCPFDHGPAPIVLDNSLLNGIVPLPPPVHNAAFQELYTPQYVNTSFPPKPFRNDNAPPVTTRELISVPTVPLPQKFDNKQKNIHGGKPAYGHIFSSLPPGVSQTTIELTNVPAELNNIPNLYENFSSFGNITLIQAKRNGDANTALLTYTNATEAALAFINVDTAIPKAKAAWYADKCILKPFPRKSIPASGQGNAKSFALKRNPAVPINNPSVVDKTSPNKTTIPLKSTPPKSPVGEPNKVTEVRKQDPGRLLSDLIKKKKDLLEKQLSSRKEIEGKIKSLEKNSKDFKTWSEVLKKLNDVIAEAQKSLQSSLIQRKEYLQKMNIVPMDSATINNMKEQQNKISKPTTPTANHAPIIKPENDCDNQLNSSNESDQVDEPVFEINVDSSILSQELENGDESAKPSQTDTKPDKETESKTPPGNIDYTRVVVTGFENGDEEDLIKHFAQFGTILDKEIDKTIPQATLIFDNRKSAEEAKKEGRNFQDRLLSVTVYGGKRYQPLVRRVATFKPQYEKEFPSYTPYSSTAASVSGGNPYKYTKNQQVHPQPTPSPRPTNPNRNVYSYRADQKSRSGANQVSKPVENSIMKLTEEEDLVTFLQKGGIDAKEVEKYMD